MATQGRHFHEIDVVRITRLVQANLIWHYGSALDNPDSGPDSAPGVGDVGTIVCVYREGNPSAPVMVEFYKAGGWWLADLLPEELELVQAYEGCVVAGH